MKRPLIVAEIGASHMGRLDLAWELIDIASAAGADAVKFQTFKPEDMVADKDMVIEDGLWAGRKAIELYEEAQLPWSYHAELFNYARSLDLIPFSSPFSVEAVEFLETLNCPMYKIASFEITDLRLIEAAARTRKHVILSTGMATVNEIEDAVLASYAAKDIALLHCVSSYPAKMQDYNLLKMIDMGNRWELAVGLSDHTQGSEAAMMAIAMGAEIIEKHITTHDGGLDDGFALGPDEFKEFVYSCRQAEQALGSVKYGPQNSEKSSQKLRRVLHFSQDLSPGTIIKPEHLKTARGGEGISPRYESSIIDMVLKTPVSANQPVNWEVHFGQDNICI